MSRHLSSEAAPLVRLDDSLRPALRLGQALIEPVRVGPAAEELAHRIRALQKRLRADCGDSRPGEIPGLAEARAVYRAAGMDPTRHRPSSEALLRRTLKGQELPVIHNAVDVCNYCSLDLLLPLGLYDMDRLHPPLSCRLGREGEGYEGIRKGRINLENRLGLFDREGGFGSPSSDSLRSCVTEGTTRLLLVVYAGTDRTQEDLQAAVELCRERFLRWCGA